MKIKNIKKPKFLKVQHKHGCNIKTAYLWTYIYINFFGYFDEDYLMWPTFLLHRVYINKLFLLYNTHRINEKRKLGSSGFKTFETDS